MPNESRFTAEQDDGVTVITLTDPLLQDTLIVTELQDALLEFLDSRGPRRLVVDFGNVTHCSSSIINGLLRVKARLDDAGGEMRLCSMVSNVLDAFRMLKLAGSVFQIDAERDDAVAALREGQT